MLVTLLVLWVVVIPAVTVAGSFLLTSWLAQRTQGPTVRHDRSGTAAPRPEERYRPRRLSM